MKFLSGIFVGRTFSADSPEPIVCNAPCLGYSFTRHEEVLTLIARPPRSPSGSRSGRSSCGSSPGSRSGIFAALKRGRWPDRLVMGISLVGYSLPSFFIGLVLIFFVIIKWQLAAVPVVRLAVREPGPVPADDDPAVDRPRDR